MPRLRKGLIALLCAVVVAATACRASAQGGTVCVYFDDAGTDCDYTPVGGGTLVTAYVIHKGHHPAGAVQFKVDYTAIVDTYLGETVTPGFLGLGTAATGIAVSYAGCVSEPTVVMSLTFYDTGLTPPNSPISVVPDPGTPTGQIEVASCNGVKLFATGGTAYWNGTVSCVGCDPPDLGPPTLAVSPATLDYPNGSSLQTLLIENTGNAGLDWTITPSVPWLAGGMIITGSDIDYIGITIDRSAFEGPQVAQLDITSNGGNATVDVTVQADFLLVSPSSLYFTDIDSVKSLTIQNAGGPTLNWNITAAPSWLSATPSSGIDDATVDVEVDRTGLAEGTYFSTLYVTSNGGNQNIQVRMDVAGTPSPPALYVDPTWIGFTPDDQYDSFRIFNSGGGTLDWSVTPQDSWIQITTPTQGSGDALVGVHVDPASVPEPHPRDGTIDVQSNGGSETVTVHFADIPPPGGVYGGTIAVYADAAGTSCEYSPVGGVANLYVVHRGIIQASASQFLVDYSDILDPYISESTPSGILALGTSGSGIALSYQGCKTTPLLLLTMTFFDQLLTPQCQKVYVLPDPNAPTGTIEVVDCNAVKQVGFGQSLIWNGTQNLCGSCGGYLKAETKTWGAVKALYKE